MLIGSVSGFLPLFSLMAGFPILIIRQHFGTPAARIMALASLLVTWLIVDPLSFVFVGLGVAVGYSMLSWRSQEASLGIAYRLSFLGGALWLAISNGAIMLLEKRSLLTFINEAITKAFALLMENMLQLDIYTPEQIELLQEFQEQITPLFNETWPIIAFVFISLSATACLLFLSRYEPAVGVRIANWRDLRAPAWLAIVTLIAFALQKLTPNIIPGLAVNTLGIGSYVLFLSGYTLVSFYMRHLRFGWGISLLFTIYLLMSPWLRPILILIGLFDALFDYRHFVRAKIEPQ